MIHDTSPLLAEGVSRTTFEWGRIQSNSDWILPIGVCLAIMLFVRYMYRRDAVELPVFLGWLLTALRTAAFLGLLILFLQPHWRSEREMVRNSKAVLLVDTSLSMGLGAGDLEPVKTPARKQGAEQKVGGDVFRHRQPFASSGVDARGDRFSRTTPQNARRFDLPVQRRPENRSRSDVKQACGIRCRRRTLPAQSRRTKLKPITAKRKSQIPKHRPIGKKSLLHRHGNPAGPGLAAVDPEGTRLAAVGHRAFSDGGQNAGISPEAAVELAREAKMPIFTVGLGSDKQADQRARQRSDRAGPGISGRPLHGDRLSPGQAHGGQGGHGAGSFASRRSPGRR